MGCCESSEVATHHNANGASSSARNREVEVKEKGPTSNPLNGHQNQPPPPSSSNKKGNTLAHAPTRLLTDIITFFITLSRKTTINISGKSTKTGTNVQNQTWKRVYKGNRSRWTLYFHGETGPEDASPRRFNKESFERQFYFFITIRLLNLPFHAVSQ